MKCEVFVPTYFDDFRCIADKCPDSCCVGWEVDIDEATAKRYSTVEGELRKKIDDCLVCDETGDKMFTLCEGDRCPFLNTCGLCEIQLTVGESFLSKTCRMFPRFFDDFGSRREMGLGLGCPEAARIILNREEAFDLKQYDICEIGNEDADEDFLERLLDLRKELFAILENKEQSIKDRIEAVLCASRDFQETIEGEGFFDEIMNRDFDDCLEILDKMEYIREERKSILNSLNQKKHQRNMTEFYKDDLEKLMKYYIFRYLLKAVYDYDVLTKVKYGVFACIVIGRIYSLFESLDFETRVRIMYGYSKEIEYSDFNMEFLDEMLYNNFGTEDMINLL